MVSPLRGGANPLAQPAAELVKKFQEIGELAFFGDGSYNGRTGNGTQNNMMRRRMNDGKQATVGELPE